MRVEILRLSILALATAALVVACDKVPLLSPTGSTISLSIDKNILPINGVATVTAVVTEVTGTPVHNGTTVTFQTSLGRIEPTEAQTQNGKAVVTFHAGSVSGSAAIHAFSGGARTGSGNSSAGGVAVLVGSAAAGSVSINVVPTTVPQNGGTVSVSARVLDTANNPLPNVAVGFTTDVGTLSNNTGITDQNGIAQTSLTTSRVTKVSANIAGKTSGDFTVNVVTAPTVTISAISPTNPVAGQTISFTITPNTAATANPVQSVLVNFGDGTTQTLNNITGPVGLTHVYNREGGYTITATATDINGIQGVSSAALVVGFAPLPTVTLSASPNPVLLASNGVTAITVTAQAAAGGPPIRSVIVRKSDGTILYSGTSTATFTYQFPSGSGQNQITATVTDAAGNTATTSTVVIVG